jgi:hypothetical protein
VTAAAVVLAWLGLNLWAQRRIRASALDRYRQNLHIAMVWVVPFLGAFLGAASLPGTPLPRGGAAFRPLPGDLVGTAPEDIDPPGGGPRLPLVSHLEWHAGVPIVDRAAVEAWIDGLAPEAREAATAAVRRAWLQHVQAALGPGYRLHESPHAWILSPLENAVVLATDGYVARTRQRIDRVLDGIVPPRESPRSILLVLDDEDTYYHYLTACTGGSGESGFSSGVFLSGGAIPHFVVRHEDLSAIEPVIAHEMTHEALSPLRLPLWLDEGLAVSTERRLGGRGRAAPRLHELHGQHVAFWNDREIAGFWTGRSFFRTDEGQALSYELAHLLVQQASRDWPVFCAFVQDARRADAGAAAAKAHLGVTLGAWVATLLTGAPATGWEPAAATASANP